MKHIKWDFSLQGQGPAPLGGLRDWAEAKIQLFLNMDMLYIKLKGMEHRAPCKDILYTYTTLNSCGGVKRSRHTFTEVVMLHIKIKRMERRAPCKHIFCPFRHLQTLDRVKRSKNISF